jgi:hypothetical protein
VPLEDVYKVWDAVVALTDPELDPIITWFQKMYIGKLVIKNFNSCVLGKKNRTNGRSKPRFPPKLWNIYESTLNGLSFIEIYQYFLF